MDYQKILEEIKSKVDIVDIISEYVNLNKTGQNYKALCPFHSEKTPSFFVSPTKQIFHCFGCGKGGDVISFLMEYEKISFQEAISMLASRLGIELSISNTSSMTKDKFYKIYNITANFYVSKLKESDLVKKYLKNRGIDEKSIEKFKIGYAPKDKNSLYKHLKRCGFDENLIRLSRLINKEEDFFQDRIIIPITDPTGRIIAFGGRSLRDSTDIPKYINSPETPIFKKGDTIFGLYEAKQQIKQKGYAILMEGYLDVILSHQYGFSNSIAPLGTALTFQQLNKIKRFTNKILLSFDSDKAGLQAVERCMSSLFQAGFIIKVMVLPKGEDPASLLQKFDEKMFKIHLSKALTPVEFCLKFSDKKTLIEKVNEALLKISFIQNLLYREELLKELSEKTSLEELTLREELKKISKEQREKNFFSSNGKSLLLNEEEILLRIGIFYPEKLNFIFDKLDMEMIENLQLREIFLKLKDNFKKENFSINNFLNNLNETQKSLVSKLIITSEINEESIDQNLIDCIKKLKIRAIDKKIKEIGKSGDKEYLSKLIKEKIDILRLLNEGL